MRKFLVSDLEGYTPQIGRLIHMMNHVRYITLNSVQGMNIEELDLLPEGQKNTVGMLLEHMIAVEKYYQLYTFNTNKASEDAIALLGERWKPGLFLGELGRNQIKGHPLSHYLDNLTETRQETLAEFSKRDDQWLEEPLPFWETTGNRHFMWFHVFEDEINHRGQIRLLTHYMPRFTNKGTTGAFFEAATNNGLGMRCIYVAPKSSAAEAGLKEKDLVLEYNDQNIQNTAYMSVPLVQPIGTEIPIKVKRGEQLLELKLQWKA